MCIPLPDTDYAKSAGKLDTDLLKHYLIGVNEHLLTGECTGGWKNHFVALALYGEEMSLELERRGVDAATSHADCDRYIVSHRLEQLIYPAHKEKEI